VKCYLYMDDKTRKVGGLEWADLIFCLCGQVQGKSERVSQMCIIWVNCIKVQKQNRAPGFAGGELICYTPWHLHTYALYGDSSPMCLF
jgi:hypothetical protein